MLKNRYLEYYKTKFYSEFGFHELCRLGEKCKEQNEGSDICLVFPPPVWNLAPSAGLKGFHAQAYASAQRCRVPEALP